LKCFLSASSRIKGCWTSPFSIKSDYGRRYGLSRRSASGKQHMDVT
jgi:hypothetical protein